MRYPGLPTIIISVAFLLSACSQQPLQKTVQAIPETTAPAVQPQEQVEYIVPEPELFPEPEAEVATVDSEFPQPVAQHADIWKKIGANLTLPRHMDSKSVKGRLAWYAKNQEYLDRVVERSKTLPVPYRQ